MELGKAAPEKKEAVRLVIKRHVEEVRACYEASLLTKPYLKGTVHTRFTLDPTGRVAHSCITESTVPDPMIDACIVDAMLKWSFASVHRDGWTAIEYPWVLAPADDRSGP